MWGSVDVEIVRELDPAGIGPFENADAKDGILLNHDYVDMRGYSIADAQEIVAEEAQLLDDIEAIGADDDRLNELLERLYEDASELSGFDVGTAGGSGTLVRAALSDARHFVGRRHHAFRPAHTHKQRRRIACSSAGRRASGTLSALENTVSQEMNSSSCTTRLSSRHHQRACFAGRGLLASGTEFIVDDLMRPGRVAVSETRQAAKRLQSENLPGSKPPAQRSATKPRRS